MEGQETELDKTIIEAIKDPLTHLVRNAVDHGIEPPDERAARGQAGRGPAARCAPSTRAARSTSRSPTTAAASTRQRVARKAVAARADHRRAGRPHERPRAGAT